MSGADDPRPTIGERYSRAIESSNLKVGERRADIDLIIAAGFSRDGLAATLLRLQVEYDSVRAGHRAAEMTLRTRRAKATEQKDPGRAEQMLKTAEGAALTEHLLILMHLRSLREAKQRFGEFAVIQATRHRFMRPDQDALAVAGRVLDVWLRPTCDHCEGRGFNGDPRRGEVQALCRPCRGSGHRRDSIGKDDAERGFASRLLMELDAKLHEAQRDIRTNLNAVEEAKARIAEQTGVAT
jgi:hypothetical protein